MGKDTVTAAQAAAKSSVALEALEGGQISLAKAAALTEFEHDGPEAVDRLVRAAGTPQFDHVVSQLRSERASAQALAQATAHYTERGFTILDEEQRWGWDPARVPMRYLQRDGDDGEPEGVDESVITDPQHWAVWLDEYTEYVDSDGNVVEEDEIDWDTADDADAEPDEGLRHADSVRERPAFAPEWFSLNPEAAGPQVNEMYQPTRTGTPASIAVKATRRAAMPTTTTATTAMPSVRPPACAPKPSGPKPSGASGAR